jgi:hypothetical protein
MKQEKWLNRRYRNARLSRFKKATVTLLVARRAVVRTSKSTGRLSENSVAWMGPGHQSPADRHQEKNKTNREIIFRRPVIGRRDSGLDANV